MNGLWANALGMGGLIPIEAQFRLATNKLDLKLTGMQGDVMKESMSVALSLAWTKTPKNRQKELLTEFSDTSLQGIHIHCPEGAVPKDGPSAGTAITVALYSLFNNIKINNKVAITGEMSLQGRVTAIGGLDLKILGGIRAGVDTFLFPKENEKEFNDFKEKYGEKDIVNGISFHMIETIDEALKLALDRKV
jgi:ATP-dependent Lon protease